MSTDINSYNKHKSPDLPTGRHKRRAPRACLSCRNRKVRCDVMRGLDPCTNCRLDGVPCILANSVRGRRLTNADGDGIGNAAGNRNRNENEEEEEENHIENLHGPLNGNAGDPEGNLGVNADGNPDVHMRPRANNLPVSLTFEGK